MTRTRATRTTPSDADDQAAPTSIPKEHPVSTSDPAINSATGSNATRLGFWAAILTAVVVAVFAAVAIATPARSGPFCTNACVTYPYVAVAQLIPGDYIWLVPGILLVPT